jgi:hypothetical protein
MTFEKPNLPAFISKGDNVVETAKFLVNLADKHSVPQSHIQVANDGFYISELLADFIGEDEDETTAGDVADALGVSSGSDLGDGDPAGTIERDREQIALAEEIAETHEQVTADEAPDTVTNEAVEDHDTSGVTDVDYDSWEYSALRAEVDRRELVTEDKKTDTLIAALRADDEAEVDDPETTAPTGE